MKLTRGLVSVSLIFSMAFVSFLAIPVNAAQGNDPSIALQRGYRTGYSDGYMAGYRDTIDGNDKSYRRHEEYAKADRAYNKDYGSIEDYQDGYKQGFEAGYDTGFDKRSFDAAIPSNISRRGIIPASYTPPPAAESISAPAAATPVSVQAASEQAPSTADTQVSSPANDASNGVTTSEAAKAAVRKEVYVASDDPVIIIPRDTELVIELTEAIDTERSREGDKFTAKVVSPVEIAGATIEGHVDKVTKPGRLKRRSELLLSFDRLVISERRWTNFDAIMTEVLPVKGDGVRTVDQEGTAIGKGSFKGDAIKIGASTGTGAGIGAVAGGPIGAAVGAGVGAAFGVGAVVIERGKHIKLYQAQQLRIKSSYETQIR